MATDLDNLVHFCGGICGQGLVGRKDSLNFPGRITGIVGQTAHLACHHRKAFTLLPGTSRLYRRVKRKQVGLRGNTGNGTGNLIDVGGLFAQRRQHLLGRVNFIGCTLGACHDIFQMRQAFSCNFRGLRGGSPG